jgi:DNA modification methylase
MRKEVIGDCTLYLGDCLDILPTLGKVDAVITDPPYNMSTSQNGIKHEIWADIIDSACFFKEVFQKEIALFDICGGTVWQFLNWKTLPTLQKAASDVGQKINSILIWNKNQLGLEPKGLRTSYELVALLCIGEAKIENRSVSDIWQYPAVSKRIHPAEKPLALIQRLVEVTSGNRVLDPFMGSGTTGVACALSGRKFIGCELNEKYFDIACRRIEEAYKEAGNG